MSSPYIPMSLGPLDSRRPGRPLSSSTTPGCGDGTADTPAADRGSSLASPPAEDRSAGTCCSPEPKRRGSSGLPPHAEGGGMDEAVGMPGSVTAQLLYMPVERKAGSWGCVCMWAGGLGGSSGDGLMGRWSPHASGGSTPSRVASKSVVPTSAPPSSEAAIYRKDEAMGRLLARGFGAAAPAAGPAVLVGAVVVVTAVRNVAVPLWKPVPLPARLSLPPLVLLASLFESHVSKVVRAERIRGGRRRRAVDREASNVPMGAVEDAGLHDRGTWGDSPVAKAGSSADGNEGFPVLLQLLPARKRGRGASGEAATGAVWLTLDGVAGAKPGLPVHDREVGAVKSMGTATKVAASSPGSPMGTRCPPRGRVSEADRDELGLACTATRTAMRCVSLHAALCPWQPNTSWHESYAMHTHARSAFVSSYGNPTVGGRIAPGGGGALARGR